MLSGSHPPCVTTTTCGDCHRLYGVCDGASMRLLCPLLPVYDQCACRSMQVLISISRRSLTAPLDRPSTCWGKLVLKVFTPHSHKTLTDLLATDLDQCRTRARRGAWRNGMSTVRRAIYCTSTVRNTITSLRCSSCSWKSGQILKTELGCHNEENQQSG